MYLARDCACLWLTVLLASGLSACTSTTATPDAVPGPDSGADPTTTGDETSTLTPEEFVAGQLLTDDAAGGQDEGVTCRIERPLGSHIRKRVCTTALQRQQADIEARHLMRTRQEVTRQ